MCISNFQLFYHGGKPDKTFLPIFPIPTELWESLIYMEQFLILLNFLRKQPVLDQNIFRPKDRFFMTCITLFDNNFGMLLIVQVNLRMFFFQDTMYFILVVHFG